VARPGILIVDDDRALRRSLELQLQGRKLQVSTAANLAEAEMLWRAESPALVILDLMLPDGEGLDLLTRMKSLGDAAKVIMITGHHDMEKAVAAMRLGAFDYAHKPLDVDELDRVLDRALAEIVAESKTAITPEASGGLRMAGRSRAILELHKAIGQASRGRASVLIRGESGTGKELVARIIHRNLAPSSPFVAVNCSALVPTLLESELFGHEKGAFTGALSRRVGRLELAGEGVMFLDEIGDLPADLQAKLLRVLQEKEFERVGGNVTLPFAAVVLAATHRDLEAMVASGEFREDLYYRLKVVEIAVPPLRERKEDIPHLVAAFLDRYNREFHREVARVPATTLAALQSYDWPGNVRELENRVQAGIMASSGDSLRVEIPTAPAAQAGADTAPGWRRSLAEVEAEQICRVLERTDWALGETCEILGISRPTLRKKIAEYGIERA
jgi:DNA-binding NtrC family response regulator